MLARWAPRTKLMCPAPAHDVVLDRDLVARVVGSARSMPLTLILAGAGSGKTTLAAAVASELAPVGWIRFDELDDDPVTVLELLVLALEPIVVGGCPSVRQLLGAGLPAALDPRRAAAVLVNDLVQSASDPVVVMLDDLHCLRAADTLAAVDYLLDHLPPAVHLIATARTEPGLSLARLRARGELGEVGAADLRLSPSQADELLNGRIGLGLPSHEVHRLVEAASGWVTGVRLLGQAPEALDAYLDAELVGREPDGVRQFLFDTAVLDVLDPGPCAALTGRGDAAAVLDDLSRRHALFVQMVDRSLPAYRYHDLLRSFLLRRLNATDPHRLALLHQAAAGVEVSPARTIEHLLAAQAWDDAAERIDSIADPFARSVDIQRVAAWAGRLPTSVRAAWPNAELLVGLAAAQRGDLGAAIATLEPIAADLEAAGKATAHWVAMRTLHIATSDHARFVPILARLEQSSVFAALPAAAQTDHHVSNAYGALFTGDWTEAGRRVGAAITIATRSGDLAAVEVLAQHLSPLLAPAPGVLERISAYAAWTDGRFPDKAPLVALGWHHQRAFLGFLRADLDAAATDARAAAALMDRLGGLPYLRATVDWVLAGRALARGDLVDAERTLRTSLDTSDASDLDRHLDLLRLGLLARVLRHQRRLDELAALAARLQMEPGTRYGDQAEWARASVTAQSHWASGDLLGAIAVLRQGTEIEARTRLAPFLVSPRVDLALVLAASGREADARSELARAVGSFAAWGTPGLLAAAGPEVLPLLRGVEGTTAAAALRSFDVDKRPAAIQVPGRPDVLTGREVEVLRLLDAGASNKDITDALVIGANTVKTHIRNVMAKLGAKSRGEAVAIARRHHLL